MEEWLIIFTRYPIPGTTKTRLIPALGAEGAADCQRQMTEWTVAIARSLQEVRPIQVEVRHSGGTQQAMEQWLGSDLAYVPQGEGDLGERLSRAFQAAFAAGATRVLTIGIDCPGIDRRRLIQAFEALIEQPGVIGPAMDGGYYLIGLSQWRPALFEGIAWGTDAVLRQTEAIAAAHQTPFAYLDPLNDVDYPEDLALWHQVRAAAATPPLVSVILPLLNEAKTIEATLDHLQACQDNADSPVLEIIAVDGGSQDGTVDTVRDRGLAVIQTRANRAYQMNIGAQAAKGDTLLFLHGDTWLPANFVSCIHESLSQPQVIAGAFRLEIRGQSMGLRWVERGVYWRSRWLQMPYGDQGIFLRAETFHALGGFPDLPIMEDFEFICQLKQQGHIATLPLAVQTSARRWQTLGIAKTTLINQLMVLAYSCGVPSTVLARWYRCKKNDG